jgi:uncharacterized protein YkwD
LQSVAIERAIEGVGFQVDMTMKHILLAGALSASIGGCVAPASETAGRVGSASVGTRAAAAALNPGEALAAVNAYRRSHGLQPVRLDAAATRAARAHSAAMAQQGVMSHSTGGEFRARLDAHGIGRAPAVENIAWGQRSFGEAMATWQASSLHAANLQTADMTRLGVAVVNTTNGAYWTLIMAGEAR